mmetsp:Transcript_11114/g.9839  ORF Transcript_11114/g.9839 Transcript_11114/m.9839 type:complete len:148 (+) Transcript_11114:466-909(+)
MVACLGRIKTSEIIRRLKTKKRHSKYKEKEMEKQLQDMFFDQQWSDGFIKFCEKDGKKIDKIYDKGADCVWDIIEARNKLFNSLKDLKQIYENSPEYNAYTKQDIVNIFKIYKRLKDTKYLEPHFLWELPTKKHNELYYNQESELTE